MIGISACAIAATTLAMYKRFDLFGCILVSMVNAIGGGSLRDIILDRHPLFWMTDLTLCHTHYNNIHYLPTVFSSPWTH